MDIRRRAILSEILYGGGSNEEPINIDNYLTIEALEDGLTAKLYYNACEYCIDGDGNWKTLSADTTTESINTGQTLSFRGNLTPNSTNGIGRFAINKKCNLKGNCMSMLFGDNAADNYSLSGKSYAFYRLFVDCTTIINVSKNFLPATILWEYCYAEMFLYCTNLISAPELPSTNIAYRCYHEMFYNCTSLTTAPELPATTLANWCYHSMFDGCSKLNYIKMLATDISATNCLYTWVRGVSSSGTFVKHPDMTSLPTGASGIPSGWIVVNDFNTDNYLTIEALENGLTASLSKNACEYCVDGDGNWKTLTAGTATESINSGHTLSFRGNLTPNNSNGIGTFTISKKCNLKGNCMSMLFGDNAVDNFSLSGKDRAFYNLFKGCSNIVSVSYNFLPATTLSDHCYNSMFRGCTSLTTAPELPATTLADYCYIGMFKGCISLTTAPELPATTMADYCYDGMFGGCTSLTTAPELPATTLSDYCYSDMFDGCTSLTTTPKLPATALADGCYVYMFEGCTNLTTAPELPATTLAPYCYGYMFNDCTSLTTAPELPATTLTNGCYNGMFYDCTSLTTAPGLPATTLTSYCYNSMFRGCTKLNYIKMLATDISASSCLGSWVDGVASSGTFVKNPIMNSLPTGSSGIPSGWTVVNDGEPIVNIDNYLTIEAREDGLTAKLSTNACEYCVDGDGNWKSLAAGTTTQSINSGHTLSFRGNLTSAFYESIGTFTISKKCNLKGNCMSILFGDSAADNFSLSGKVWAFYKLFQDCTNIINVSKNFLPATTLSDSCYYRMFNGCTSLTTAPELPATALAYGCYNCMFQGCTNLTTAPTVLPATTLASDCYNGMFNLCTSLMNAPELPATTLATYCYSSMFYGCTKLNYIKMLATDISASSCLNIWVYGVASAGTFVKNPDMTSLPTGDSGIPRGWTVVNDGVESINTDNYLTIEALQDGLTASLSINNCEYCVDGDGNWKSLATGTATESINSGQTLSFRGNITPTSSKGIGTFTITKKCNLKGNCMSMLFGDAGKDNYSLSGKDYAFCNLFNGCTSLISASALPATTLANYCYNSMFSGCTSLTTAPALPATTLKISCYNSMFSGCTSLTTAPDLPATVLALGCYRSMFQDCTNLTVVPSMLPATTLAEMCYYSMFQGCTSLITTPALPANRLAMYCYYSMFQGCTSLTVSPALPAKSLEDVCYNSMFYGCTNLTTSPELPATTLKQSCYTNMFRNCSKLNYIKMLATDISAYNCLGNWVSGVASSGTFVKHANMTSLPTGSSGIPRGWTVVNDGEESGGNLITFTIDGTEYQAEEGMTWGEWVNSEYNTGNFIIDEDTDALFDTMGLGLPVVNGGMLQMSTLKIISGNSYILG